MIKIIVSRYNEDVRWIKYFDINDVIVYNKGYDIPYGIDGYTVINHSNVGREGHTYYKYICDNYDNLPDYVIFLQGYPFDHTKNIINDIKDLYNKNILDDFIYLSTCLVNFNFEKGCGYIYILDLNNTYEKIFKKSSIKDKIYTFGTGAQFMVSRNAILRRPKSFYEGIVNMLGYSIDPIEGYGLERIHKIIFTEDV